MSENFAGKTILIVGAGLLQKPAILAAKKLGLSVAALDGNPNAVGLPEADHFIHASTLDADEALSKTEQFAKDNPIHGVLTVGTDASYTVARIAAKFGLPGITPDTAVKATNKYLMRQALKKAGVPVPVFSEVSDLHSARKAFETLGGDCVIKPVQNMGARGVRRISSVEQLDEAFDLAKSFSKSGAILLEKFLDMPELSYDALVYRGEITITGIADRIIEYEPFFVETGHIMPTDLPADWVERATEVFKQGIRALGIENGAAKGDIKVCESGAYIGEIAARLSGGFMSAYTYPYSSGVDLMTNVVRIALGEPPQGLTSTKKMVSVERAIIAAPGTVRSITGEDKAAKISGVANVFIDCKIGDKIISPQNNLDKQGHVITIGATRAEAMIAAHRAVREIRIATEQEKDEFIPVEVIRNTAREKFHGVCNACDDCDGKRCRGKMPGVGGIDSGMGFIRAIQRIRQIELIPNYINNARTIDTKINFFGVSMDMPVFPAPITGAVTNLGGAITELEFARAMVKGANQAGLVGSVGDGATPTKYKIGLQAISENFGMAFPVFKPRYDQKLIMQRIEEAKLAGAVAVGIDIDAASFLTMNIKGQDTSAKSVDEIRELVECAGELPLILKGILSAHDAERALRAGVKGIIVSNHGGRVGASLISPVDALPVVKDVAGNDAFIILDGGVRSGPDVVKAIALGADAAMMGRPVMVAAVGAGVQGVRQYFQSINYQLKRNMTLLGIGSLADLKGNKDVLYFPNDYK